MILIEAGDLQPGDTIEKIGRVVGRPDKTSTPGDVTFRVYFTNAHAPAAITLGVEMPVWVESLRAQR